MDNKYVALIIGATVAIISIAFVLMPVINDAVDETRAYYNNEYPAYAELSDDEELTLSFDGTTYTVNDVTVPLQNYARLVMSDKMIVNRSSNTSMVQAWDGAEMFKHANLQSFTIVVSENQANISVVDSEGTHTKTVSFDWFYYVNTSGDFRMYQVDTSNSRTVYVNGSDDLVSVSWTDQKIYALRDDVVTINGEIDGSFTANLDAVSGVKDVYTVFVTNNPETTELFFNDDESTIAINALLVPYEVYGTKDNLIGAEALLFSIPVIIIMAILAAFIMAYRYD